MRIAMLVAVALLVAGCSQQSGQPRQTGSNPTSTGASGTAPPATKPAPGSTAPGSGAPISDVIAWIESGHPADATRYHSATLDGVSNGLGDDIAVTAGKVTCMTDAKHTGGALACLVDLEAPLPRPAAVEGMWKGGWVDYDGSSLQVGAARADPGPFVNGKGPELANGDSLSFGDFRCRADQAGLFCVNYAHRSAVRLAAAGIETFGCLRSVPPPEGIGERFSC